MNRSLIRESVVYGVGILLTRALGFLLIPLYTRYLTVSEYGALSLLLLILQGINFLCVLGVSSAALRLHFSASADDQNRRDAYANATLLLLIFPLVVILCVGPVVWWTVDTYVPSIPFFPYVAMILVMGLFTPLITLMSGLLTAQRRPGAYVAFHLGYFSVQAIAIVAAVAGLGYGLLGQVSSQLLTCAVFGCIAVVILVRYARPRWSKDVALQLLAFGIPLVPFFLCSWIDVGAGRFALENYLDLRQVGIFSLASQFAGILTLISGSLDQALLPHFLRRAIEKDASTELGTLVVRYLAFFGLLAVGILVLSVPTILLTTTPNYFDAIAFVGPLILANLLYVARSPIVWSLNHSGRTGTLSAINVISTGLFALLLVLLLGHFAMGISGVAYAMIIANLFAIGAGFLYAQQRFQLHPPWRTLLAAAGTLVAGTAVVLNLATGALDPVRLAVQLGILFAVAVALYRILALGSSQLRRSADPSDLR